MLCVLRAAWNEILSKMGWGQVKAFAAKPDDLIVGPYMVETEVTCTQQEGNRAWYRKPS